MLYPWKIQELSDNPKSGRREEVNCIVGGVYHCLLAVMSTYGKECVQLWVTLDENKRVLSRV